ncbi:MAG: ROK family protein [Methylococcaceae bacterium]|nr:ROK family protein [Methylococcaceae bacterium]
MKNPRIRFGIDLGGTKIELIVLDAAGEEIWRLREPTPQGDYRGTLEVMRQLVAQAESELGEPGSVGIGTPGAVSRATGRLKNANSVCLNGQPLAEDLERLLGRPVRIANDADCFALSEASDGAAAGLAVVFGVILGTGVGGGIVVHGHLLQGPNAIAGEWGHNPLPWPRPDELPGPACYCGKHGCIETFVSGPGLERDYRQETGAALTAKAILALTKAGDATAEAAFQRYEERLARALGHVMNILDPDAIVLGGGMSNCARLYANVPRIWDRHVFSDRVDTLLLPPRHGDSSGVRGAAWLWDDG